MISGQIRKPADLPQSARRICRKQGENRFGIRNRPCFWPHKADSYGANQYQYQSAFVQIARRIVQIGGLIYLTNPEHKLAILQIRDTIVLGIGKLPIRLPDWLGKLTPPIWMIRRAIWTMRIGIGIGSPHKNRPNKTSFSTVS